MNLAAEQRSTLEGTVSAGFFSSGEKKGIYSATASLLIKVDSQVFGALIRLVAGNGAPRNQSDA